jgi:DNA-binding CsgD family transcriptional regulator
MSEGSIALDAPRMRLSDFIEQSNGVADRNELAALFVLATAGHGFDRCVCGPLTNPEIYDVPPEAPTVIITYPEAWSQHYFESGYLAIDPIVSLTPVARRAYWWSDLQGLTPQQKNMFREADEFGLRNGLCVPIHGPLGSVFAVSLATSQWEKPAPGTDQTLTVLSNQMHTVLLSLLENGKEGFCDQIHLSDRERECLLWSTRGKSSWDIGEVLNISDNTVNFHLKSAMKKLKASSRIMAITKAIRMGLLAP